MTHDIIIRRGTVVDDGELTDARPGGLSRATVSA